MLTLLLFLVETAFGSIFAVATLSLRQIPPGFPSLVAHIAAGCWAAAGVLALRGPAGGGPAAAPHFFVLAVASILFGRLMLLERRRAAGALLVAILIGGAFVLVREGGLLAARVPDGALSSALVGASLFASALLVGSALVAMILGHWYLIPPPLPFKHLVRAAIVFLAACLARTAVSLVSLLLLSRAPEAPVAAAAARLFRIEGDAVFLTMRVFWGILGPLVLSLLVLRTARMRANQSATGLLYVGVVFVLIGELLANFLLVQNALPL